MHALSPAAGTPRCGQPFQPPDPGQLSLACDFPRVVAAGEPVVAGSVEVTSQVALSAVALPTAEAFLVRDGLVVTLPPAQDAVGFRLHLAPAAGQRLPALLSLIRCGPDASPVPPGFYDLYARVVLVADDGLNLVAVGGPTPIEVR